MCVVVFTRVYLCCCIVVVYGLCSCCMCDVYVVVYVVYTVCVNGGHMLYGRCCTNVSVNVLLLYVGEYML